LQKEIDLSKKAEIIALELNSTELPVVENKLKESNSLNKMHDDDEMVNKLNCIITKMYTYLI